ncbi:hypothetical protein ACFVR2_22970 [Gottfriedia sp. NPDC057991]|uniref:hypothetical protein n=1 Tax=Gottfriedia sp. NPDC057991 TaxID=3346298 RepID=UPI0036DCECFF
MLKKPLARATTIALAGSLLAAPISSYAQVKQPTNTSTENGGVSINPMSLNNGTWQQTVDGEVYQITKTKDALSTTITVKNLSDISVPDVTAVQWVGSNSLDYSIDGGESFYVEGDQAYDSESSGEIVNPIPEPPTEVIATDGGYPTTGTYLTGKEGLPYFAMWKRYVVNGKVRWDMTSYGATKQRYQTKDNYGDITNFKNQVDDIAKDTMSAALAPVIAGATFIGTIKSMAAPNTGAAAMKSLAITFCTAVSLSLSAVLPMMTLAYDVGAANRIWLWDL